MVRHIAIIVPHERAAEVVSTIRQEAYAYKIERFDTTHSAHINFKTRSKHLQSIMGRLNDIGCGLNYGSLDVFSVITTRPSLVFKDKDATSKRAYRISDRMSIDEINDMIDEGNHLTFDFMALIATASIISGAGLISDNAAAVIASMLVSPLMGPILSLTFGIATTNMDVVRRGLRNETVGVLISLVVGLIMGIGVALCYPSDFRSSEMVNRGEATGLLFGLIVAAPSGMGVVLAVSMGGINAIVGTAISASLLPPVVNAGMLFAMSFVYFISGADSHDVTYFANLAGVSFLLWLINFIIIVVVGFLTFRYVKKVVPPPSLAELKELPSMNLHTSHLSNNDLTDIERRSVSVVKNKNNTNTNQTTRIDNEENGVGYDYDHSSGVNRNSNGINQGRNSLNGESTVNKIHSMNNVVTNTEHR